MGAIYRSHHAVCVSLILSAVGISIRDFIALWLAFFDIFRASDVINLQREHSSALFATPVRKSVHIDAKAQQAHEQAC